MVLWKVDLVEHILFHSKFWGDYIFH